MAPRSPRFRFALAFCLVTLLLATGDLATGQERAPAVNPAKTPLDEYVAKADSTYEWKIAKTVPGDGVTTFPPGLDLTFDTYRPLYEELFDLPGPANAAIQGLPEEHESWLPHGMYRHWNGTHTLALFLANPWGVRHAILPRKVSTMPPTLPPPTRPMNPFTFDFLDPQSSPTSNTYDYEFDFDPTDYGIGAGASYSVERRTYDLSCAARGLDEGLAQALDRAVDCVR